MLAACANALSVSERFLAILHEEHAVRVVGAPVPVQRFISQMADEALQGLSRVRIQASKRASKQASRQASKQASKKMESKHKE